MFLMLHKVAAGCILCFLYTEFHSVLLTLSQSKLKRFVIIKVAFNKILHSSYFPYRCIVVSKTTTVGVCNCLRHKILIWIKSFCCRQKPLLSKIYCPTKIAMLAGPSSNDELHFSLGLLDTTDDCVKSLYTAFKCEPEQLFLRKTFILSSTAFFSQQKNYVYLQVLRYTFCLQSFCRLRSPFLIIERQLFSTLLWKRTDAVAD